MKQEMQVLHANYLPGDVKKRIQTLYRQPISVASEKIVLVPFYFFTFIIYKAENNVVKEYKRVCVAFDSTSCAFSDFNNSLILASEPDLGPNTEVVKQNPGMGMDEAKHIVRVMLSHKYSVPLQNIELLRAVAAYWPFCEISLNRPEKKNIKADLFKGKILSVTPKPSFSVVLKETLDELKSPKGWLHYTKEVLKDSAKLIIRFAKMIAPKNLQQALLLVLILLLFIIFLTNYF